MMVKKQNPTEEHLMSTDIVSGRRCMFDGGGICSKSVYDDSHFCSFHARQSTGTVPANFTPLSNFGSSYVPGYIFTPAAFRPAGTTTVAARSSILVNSSTSTNFSPFFYGHGFLSASSSPSITADTGTKEGSFLPQGQGVANAALQVVDDLDNPSKTQSSLLSGKCLPGPQELVEEGNQSCQEQICSFPGCTRLARGWKDFCIAHGGGKTCAVLGCTRFARGANGFCIRHGGGKRCTVLGCTKSAHGSTSFCMVHCARKRCTFQGCTRSKGGLNDFCIVHEAVTDFCEEEHDKFAMGRSEFCAANINMVHEKENRQQKVESSVSIGMVDYELDGKTLVQRGVLAAPERELCKQKAACFLFPQDYEFEKDMLVQLWIAAGLVKEEPLQCIAGQHFDILVSRHIRHSRIDLVTGKHLYKRNGNDLSNLLPKSSYIFIDSNSNVTDHLSTETSHVSVKCSSQIDSPTLGGFKRFKPLKTLLFLHGHKSSIKQVPRDLFLSLEHLQVLDMSRTHIAEVPNSIAKMKSLCYLDLSQTPITRLPETIDHLNNLQTLRLKGCSNLSMLPKGTRKLVNLRHLDIDVLRQLRSMPKGMGALTKLRTLSAFLVGTEGECSIGQLRNMNNLKGSFCISRLENVLSEEDAIEACLCNKSQLMKLELWWSDSRDGDDIEDGKILSSLQTNSSLEELRIVCYGGFEMPRWICDPGFARLVSITIFECENCLVLPSLGQLSALKVLNMVEFHKLEVIDHNFRGGVDIQGFIAFPKLEKLTIENMFSLEEWTGTGLSDFPCLVKLIVKNCPKLYSLCALSCLCSLKNLEISHCTGLTCPDGKFSASVETFIVEDCPLISSRFVNDGGEDWSKVAHVPDVWVDHQERSFGQIS